MLENLRKYHTVEALVVERQWLPLDVTLPDIETNAINDELNACRVKIDADDVVTQHPRFPLAAIQCG